jgi:hypothetical protein
MAALVTYPKEGDENTMVMTHDAISLPLVSAQENSFRKGKMKHESLDQGRNPISTTLEDKPMQ